MIQFKNKNIYYSKSKRWYKLPTIKTFDDLDFFTNSYIIGEKIFVHKTAEAEEAFNAVKMWSELHG